MAIADLGVYLHIPFCERICPYCDFAVVRAPTLPRAQEQRYVAALLAELDLRLGRDSEQAWTRPLATLYFGGGTPSLLHPESIGELVDRVCSRFVVSGELEVTLEVNPSTLERERLAGFRRAGINRLSIGIQSFDDDVLKRLGRAHRATEGQRTLVAARAAGFDNLSIDLITGAPAQTRESLERDLASALSFAPEHLSAYELTIEAGTPFALARSRSQLAIPGEDAAASLFETLCTRLEDAGLARYEVSSFAREGFESRHNARYWRRLPVLGLGVGAWSYAGPSPQASSGLRSGNTRRLDLYLERVESARSPEESRDRLSRDTARGEAVWLSLRQREGLCAAAFAGEYGAPPRAYFHEAIEQGLALGLLEESEAGDLQLSRRGWRFADEVATGFVEASVDEAGPR